MPIIKRTQPTTLHPKPSFAFASQASSLAGQGLSPRQVDASLTASQQRGAGHVRRPSVLGLAAGASASHGSLAAASKRPTARPLARPVARRSSSGGTHPSSGGRH